MMKDISLSGGDGDGLSEVGLEVAVELGLARLMRRRPLPPAARVARPAQAARAVELAQLVIAECDHGAGGRGGGAEAERRMFSAATEGQQVDRLANGDFPHGRRRGGGRRYRGRRHAIGGVVRSGRRRRRGGRRTTGAAMMKMRLSVTLVNVKERARERPHLEKLYFALLMASASSTSSSSSQLHWPLQQG